MEAILVGRRLFSTFKVADTGVPATARSLFPVVGSVVAEPLLRTTPIEDEIPAARLDVIDTNQHTVVTVLERLLYGPANGGFPLDFVSAGLSETQMPLAQNTISILAPGMTAVLNARVLGRAIWRSAVRRHHFVTAML